MDAFQFDRFTSALTTTPSRRVVLQSLVATVFGLAPGLSPAAVHARKRKSKVQLNEFGCVNVGGKCRGQDALCCSGICQGKKPKKGKQDKSRCVAHHVGGCTVDRHICLNPTAAMCSAASTTAFCYKTTGNAGFCAEADGTTTEANCRPCRRDPDCEALGFGDGAACVISHTEGYCIDGCEDVNESTGTACLAPAAP